MKTIIGLFGNIQAGCDAIDDLEAHGFDRNEINLVAQHQPAAEHPQKASDYLATVGAGFGLLAGLAISTIPGLGVVAVAGPIAGGATGGLVGGLFGSLVDARVSDKDAQQLAEGVRRGDTLVALATRDDEAPRAVEIMNRHNPVHVNESAPMPAA